MNVVKIKRQLYIKVSLQAEVIKVQLLFLLKDIIILRALITIIPLQTLTYLMLFLSTLPFTNLLT